jgi:arylsulfatase A-like enzyme
MLGEHDIMFNHHGIWEQTVRVPMIIVPPGGEHAGKRISAQVRLMDLSNTILAMAKMELMEGTESANLLRFMTGELNRDLASLIVGRTGRALDKGTLFGYRLAKQGAQKTGQNLKIIWQPDAGAPALFDLTNDRHEQVDIAADQQTAVGVLQARIEEEVGGLRSASSDLDADTKERLRALGYLE